MPRASSKPLVLWLKLPNLSCTFTTGQNPFGRLFFKVLGSIKKRPAIASRFLFRMYYGVFQTATDFTWRMTITTLPMMRRLLGLSM